jgi:hypothetical protein
MVQGSLTGTESPAPPVYSTDPNSAYFAMVKEVYDVSLTLTADQIATGLYFRIIQVMHQAHTTTYF